MSERRRDDERRGSVPDRRTGLSDRRDVGRRRKDRIDLKTRAIRAQHAPTYKRIAQGLLLVLLFFETLAVAGLVAYGLRDHDSAQKAALASRKAAHASAVAGAALSAIASLLARQHLQIEQGCQRLNIQRATVNSEALSQYNVDRVVLTFSLAAPVNAQTRRFDRAFLPQLHRAVRDAEWTPLTDCAQAVAEHGVAYRAPSPVRFARRMPPLSALDPHNAAMPTPAQSVP